MNQAAPTETPQSYTHLQDFGTGIVAGMHRAGVTTFSDYDLPRLHGAFKAAFEVVKEQVGQDRLDFVIILNQFHGTTPDVDAILYHWLGVFYTKDAPGNTYRTMGLSDEWSDRLLADLEGGAELYDRATRAFLDHLRG